MLGGWEERACPPEKSRSSATFAENFPFWRNHNPRHSCATPRVCVWHFTPFTFRHDASRRRDAPTKMTLQGLHTEMFRQGSTPDDVFGPKPACLEHYDVVMPRSSTHTGTRERGRGPRCPYYMDMGRSCWTAYQPVVLAGWC
jgi:hypothetical protein